MKLEDQCVNLELAKKLKELGVKQNAYWKWISNDEGTTWILWPFEVLHDNEYSAFTATELGEILPEKLIDKEYDEEVYLICDFYTGIKRVMYCHDDPDSSPFIDAKGNSEANARAKMLIFLIENKLMELPNE